MNRGSFTRASMHQEELMHVDRGFHIQWKCYYILVMYYLYSRHTVGRCG